MKFFCENIIADNRVDNQMDRMKHTAKRWYTCVKMKEKSEVAAAPCILYSALAMEKSTLLNEVLATELLRIMQNFIEVRETKELTGCSKSYVMTSESAYVFTSLHRNKGALPW
ncbi:hypothetical protein AVEN_262783-1 [Araneus ventricosus]|uniref:Uncharacterized protein n=1 Tax=Araneus ventricosus TaxID=182803 RepID=A0A4Y2LCP8_ARAVE|nr:hypothetical protein AVEN_262783-1 [Araneus ventricosus]